VIMSITLLLVVFSVLVSVILLSVDRHLHRFT